MRTMPSWSSSTAPRCGARSCQRRSPMSTNVSFALRRGRRADPDRVRCVIAGRLGVDDEPASLFATTFYGGAARRRILSSARWRSARGGLAGAAATPGLRTVLWRPELGLAGSDDQPARAQASTNGNDRLAGGAGDSRSKQLRRAESRWQGRQGPSAAVGAGSPTRCRRFDASWRPVWAPIAKGLSAPAFARSSGPPARRTAMKRLGYQRARHAEERLRVDEKSTRYSAT